MGRLTKKFDDGYGSTECYHSCSDCYGNECESVTLMVEKLAHYEDMEEQGRLIELPCAVGDTVWVAYNKTNGAEKVEYLSADYIVADLEAGYCIGRTKEEAEAKLKELEGMK